MPDGMKRAQVLAGLKCQFGRKSGSYEPSPRKPVARMFRKLLFVGLVLLFAVSFPAFADSIPYPWVGTVAPTNTFTATLTGAVTGYFVSGGSAVLTDYVGLYDVTTNTFSGWLFNNHTTAPGASVNFGSVHMGDTLVVEVLSLAGFYASDPGISWDGVNHVYSTTWAGGMLNGVYIPAGTYFGVEDLPKFASDLNYNDDSFVLKGVSAINAVPEPISLLLFGVGFLGIVGLTALSHKKHN